MWVIANTTVRILESTPVPEDNEWGDETVNDSIAASGVSASITEQTRTVLAPSSGRPRVIRDVVGRVPNGTVVTVDSKVYDETNDRTYAVRSVRQHSNPLYTSEIILELVRVDAIDP